MNERCNCNMEDYSLPFAAWEIRLYLNSHPNDRCALRLYHKLIAKLPCGNYASIYLDCPTECEEESGSALDCMDNAACPCNGNLDELMADSRCCECQEGDCCPLTWCWLEDPWPWEGNCPHCAG